MTGSSHLRSTANLLLAASVGMTLCGQPARISAQTAKPDTGAVKPADGNNIAGTATTSAKTDTLSSALPQIDKEAMALLRHNQQAMFALKTYSAECHETQIRTNPRPGFQHLSYALSTLVAGKPNKMRYDHWYMRLPDKPIESWAKPKQFVPDYVFACDGTTLTQEFGTQYRLSKFVAPLYMSTLLEPWRGFFRTDAGPLAEVERARKENTLHVVRRDGREAVNGVMCDKVFVDYDTAYAGNAMRYQITWYFGPDGLTRRCVDGVDTGDVGNGGFTNDSTLVNLRVNEPVDTSLFTYTPPKGVKEMVQEPPAPLLANGTAAPDISATDRDNKPVKLSDLRGKVVVIDFWASWCPPCNAAMPHNQAVIKKLQAEGLPVVMLAVDNGDTRAAFDDWIKRQGKDFNALQFVFVPATEPLSSQYRASVIPTQYVLDKNGMVRTGFMGYEGPTDALETAIRAALAADTGKPTADTGKPTADGAKSNNKKPIIADTGTKTAAVHDNR